MSSTANPTDVLSYQKRVKFTRAPEVVFEALATPAGVSGWWMPTTGEGAEGTELRMAFPPGVGVFRVDTTRPSSRVEWTVTSLDFLPDWVGTRIVFELHPTAGGGTELEFHHEGLTPQLECFDQCRQGWNYYLPSLHDHVETGSGRPGDRHSPR
jgi:uncharacterized protein YndB with AHSA1/START domain